MKDDVKKQLCKALKELRNSDFRDGHLALLKTLGYQSTRTLSILNAEPEAFKTLVNDQAEKQLDEDKAKFSDWHHADLLFQLTDEELKGASRQEEVETGLKSYIFFAVKLAKDRYSRTGLATITRQINRLFPMPVMVLYTYGELLSIAVINRRPHKRDKDRDVLEKVTFIKDVRLEAPHRAHLDILSELYLPELTDNDGASVTGFDALHQAWERALKVEQLNKHFYQELYRWFERAVKESKFPDDHKGEGSEQRQVIRLITRLLFIWFLKEKGLVAEELFKETRISDLLKNYDRDKGSSYYRAVLQNLFFATLNTEMGKRNFSKVTNKTHRDFSLYRYKKEMARPDDLLNLFKQTPFINGGLFDCLDSFEGSRRGGYRIDYFTDNVINLEPKHKEYGKLSVPNRLFFDDEGLIRLLNHYKFTVEENTPIEQEVALDPELLGKVFENLLAAYNPETRETARKQTGSYYTPRPIVDYMVDEALIASLSEQASPSDGDLEFWRERLRYLLDYKDAFDDAALLFDMDETKRLVGAIARLKILDPAVGSGAFPMSVLHKLTLALKRLDPDNKYWERLQKDRAKEKADAAFETQDQKERDAELQEISKTFEQYRNSDFGRKLYLIQNSIYGVDIQPIACQIARLRFFISLAIEQEPTDDADNNYGIKPLPNLETRFVAADTLLSIEAPLQRELFRKDIEDAEKKLVENREQYFHATTRKKKHDCKGEDKKNRAELSEALQNAKLPKDDANKIAQWDPYDQNAKADWFDAEYMFGIKDGFDLVLGNPPYIQLQKSGGTLGKLYQPASYKTFTRSGDIYVLFYERGAQLLKDGGHLCFITSNSWLKAKYGGKLRHYFSENHTPLNLLDMGKDVFKNAIVDSSILLAKTGKSDIVGKTVDIDRLPDQPFPPDENLWGELRIEESQPWMALSAVERSIMDKMQALGTPLKEWDISINYGIKTGYNTAFIVDKATKEALVAEDPNSAELLKPILRGRDIKRYQAKWAGLWVIATLPSLHINIENYPAIKRHLLSYGKDRLEQTGKTLAGGSNSRKKTPHQWFELQDTCAYHAEFMRDKLVWMDLTDQGRFGYDEGKVFCTNTAFIMTGQSIKYLCPLLNSNLITWFMRHTSLNSGMGVTRWIVFTVEAISIPQIPASDQKSFIQLLDRILAAKAKDPNADITALEAEIDSLVYQLYGLTNKEIEIVEGLG